MLILNEGNVMTVGYCVYIIGWYRMFDQCMWTDYLIP